ncbi:unnamed protein product [Mytilus edulis]|uniref:Uncharacterized protein n=1 Tax=Mytilus edulis TaxID=6550 RepID=A0A8S3SK86_MYTED|nr:unnamed protein product [Mytilus edulis]
MLHIAAQRGYIKIVKELLHRNVTLLYQYNTMQLNAFHLAAENGHVQVLKVFMNINSSLADSHSLYFASKNGHTKVVVLLQKYVDEKCLPCNVDISWRPTVRIVEEQKYGQLFYEYDVVDTNHLTNLTKINTFNVWRKNLEDIRLLTCDTPLNAAVRNGHIEIVKVLIQKGVGTVNCSIYDGSIPLLLQ